MFCCDEVDNLIFAGQNLMKLVLHRVYPIITTTNILNYKRFNRASKSPDLSQQPLTIKAIITSKTINLKDF